MKVLLAHRNFSRGGGDSAVVLATYELLKSKGDSVSIFSVHDAKNKETPFSKYFVPGVDLNTQGGLMERLRVAGRVLYSFEAKRNIKRLIEDHRPDVAHLHAIYHVISPSIIDALKKAKVPVVMTLHEYKLVCATYRLLNRGKLCEVCREGRYYNCFMKKCTKDSYLKSFLNMVEMYLHHSLMKIFDKVDVFIAPSEFLKDKMKKMGFRGKVVCLSNFIDISKYESSYALGDGSIVYFGRLSPEKGLLTLIDAVKGIDVRLKIIGDGPQREILERKLKEEGVSNVELLGFKSGQDLFREVSNASFTVLPSEWFENNPITVMESFALGKPVLGSDIGGIPELVVDGVRGRVFEPWNVDDLKQKIIEMIGDPAKLEDMGKRARAFAEAELSSDSHYEKLMEIYRGVMV